MTAEDRSADGVWVNKAYDRQPSTILGGPRWLEYDRYEARDKNAHEAMVLAGVSA